MTYQKLIERHLLPVWKNKHFNSITRQDVKKLLFEKQASGLVVNNLRICISAIFAEAVERELITINPARNLGKVFRNGMSKAHIQFLNKEQVADFLKIVQQDAPQHYGFLLTAFRTGMRLGELLGIAWEDIDFNTKQITVCRSFSQRHWDTPKSHKVRRVDMSGGLCETLQELFQKRNINLACQSYPSKNIHLVFPRKNGEPLNNQTFRRNVFYFLLDKAGLPKIRIHDMRHTYASLLLQIGAPLHYVKEQLGHSTIATTVDLYGHCQPGANRDAINQLDA